MGRHVGSHQHGGRKPAKPSGVHFGYFKAFLLPAELSHTDIDVSITCQLIRPKTKNTRQIDVFMYVTCLEQLNPSVTQYAKI